MPKPNDPSPPHRNASAGLFGIFLFSAMVGAICTVAVLVLTEDWQLIGAVGLGLLLAVIVGVALSLMLRNPLPPAQESRSAFEPLSTYRKGEVAREGQGVGGTSDARPTSTQDTLAVGGATGGMTDVAVAANAGARSPGEPAERPVPGAGAPGGGVAATIVEAARNGGGGSRAPETAEDAAPGGGDPGGVDPEMPAAGPGTSAAGAAETFEDAPATGAGERHGGGGDPGGVDAEMPDADAPSGESAAQAAEAFEADQPRGDVPASNEGAGAAAGGAEQVEPQRRDGPREDGPDDLKRIKGVGPVLEEMLFEMGIYHFDQIADWGPGEVAWADENLQGFKGRVSRDDWVGQARDLRDGGGETEFASPHVTRD